MLHSGTNWQIIRTSFKHISQESKIHSYREHLIHVQPFTSEIFNHSVKIKVLCYVYVTDNGWFHRLRNCKYSFGARFVPTYTFHLYILRNIRRDNCYSFVLRATSGSYIRGFGKQKLTSRRERLPEAWI